METLNNMFNQNVMEVEKLSTERHILQDFKAYCGLCGVELRNRSPNLCKKTLNNSFPFATSHLTVRLNYQKNIEFSCNVPKLVN